jgi:hypothetical protein
VGWLLFITDSADGDQPEGGREGHRSELLEPVHEASF